MSDDRPDEGAPSDPRPSGRIRIVGAQPATGEHPAVGSQPPQPAAPTPAPDPTETEGPVADDPNRFGAIPIISADEPPKDPTPPRGVPTEDPGTAPPPAAAAPPAEPEPPAPAPARPAPDLDDLDLPPTAAVPVIGGDPEPPAQPEPVAAPEPPAPAPTPAPRDQDLDDIRVWAAPSDDEDDLIEAGRSAPESPFADLMGDDDDDLDILGPVEDDLPHWSEPAEAAEDEAWAGVSSGPRWRGQGEESGEPEDFSDLIDETYVEPAPPAGEDDEMIFDDTDAVDPVESSAGPPQRRNPYPDAPDELDEGPGGGAAGRDMQQAVVVGVGFVVAFVITSFIGSWAVLVLALGVIVAATAEFFTATRRAGYHPAPLVGLVGSAGLVLGAYWKGEIGIPLILFVFVLLAMCWWLFDAGPGDHAVPNMGITVLGVMYVGFLGSFAALLLRQPNGIGMLFGAVLVTVAADVGGLFIGQRMGRSPLTAASPNKTIEGFVGGIVASFLAAFVVLGLLGWFPWGKGDAAVLGIVGGIMAPLGDLCESRLKRDLGVKDMGNVLPGHGGVLDRFDGLLFVLPATYSVVLLLEVYLNTP